MEDSSLGPTGYGDSPYQSFSAFAGNPYFIDLELLCKQGLLTSEECFSPFRDSQPDKVNYAAMYRDRLSILKKAFFRFHDMDSLDRFREKSRYWLEDYALFMSLKAKYQQQCWNQWPEPLRIREPFSISQARTKLKQDIHFQCK